MTTPDSFPPGGPMAHQPKQRRRRNGVTEREQQAKAEALEALIRKIIQAPSLELAKFIRDEYALSMEWAEVSRSGNFVIIDKTRYDILNKAVQTVPGMIRSLHGILRSLLFSDAKSTVYEQGPHKGVFNTLRSYEHMVNKERTGWWWRMCEELNHKAHAQFGKDTPRETVIRATVEGMDMEALLAFIDENDILVDKIEQSSYRTLVRGEGDLILELAKAWIYSPTPEDESTLTPHPGKHPGWKDGRQAALNYERDLKRWKEEEQWRRGFPADTLGNNAEAMLILLRLRADDEQEWNEAVVTPWAAIEGSHPLPSSTTSLFTEANPEAQKESA